MKIKIFSHCVIKLVKEQKKSQWKYYQMVLNTIKNLLPIKNILKQLSSSGINNYIKILQKQKNSGEGTRQNGIR